MFRKLAVNPINVEVGLETIRESEIFVSLRSCQTSNTSSDKKTARPFEKSLIRMVRACQDN
jgi:hypothetical protein